MCFGKYEINVHKGFEGQKRSFAPCEVDGGRGQEGRNDGKAILSSFSSVFTSQKSSACSGKLQRSICSSSQYQQKYCLFSGNQLISQRKMMVKMVKSKKTIPSLSQNLLRRQPKKRPTESVTSQNVATLISFAGRKFIRGLFYLS